MRGYIAVILMFILASCAGNKEDRIVLQKTSYTTLPAWGNQDKTVSFKALKQSCQAFSRQKPDTSLQMGKLSTSVHRWQEICNRASGIAETDRASINRFFEQEFQPYKVSNNSKKEGLFTGYYEPLLHGSRHKHGKYQYPLYRLPSDVVSGKPYHRRDQINRGVLAGRNLELVYVDDPVQAFFLEIQGSGRVLLDDGSIMRLGYAGKNNQPYVAIGKYMKEKGMIPASQISAQSIKSWLYANQTQARNVMEQNPSYVFFRELPGHTGGPIGGQGIALTPETSLAVDRKFIPYGVPLWVETTLPDGNAFQKLMVAQDTGGAIKGPVRGDIFFGFGQQAEHHAGLMKQQGSYVALWPKERSISIASSENGH